MADPSSVAGTAVGIASLGIQVCQGLITYLRSVQGYRQDVSDGLKEVEALIQVFYSINNLIPKIDRIENAGSSTVSSTMLCRCLKENKDKVLELHKLLVSLGVPLDSTGSFQKASLVMKSLIFPFREGKLKSLQESLRVLLDKMNLALAIVSQEFNVLNAEKSSVVEATLERLEVGTRDGLTMIESQSQKNQTDIQSLKYRIRDSLDTIEQRLMRTECFIEDLDQNVSGRLTMIQDETRSIAANNLVTNAALIEMLRRIELQTQELPGMNMKISQIESHPHHTASSSSSQVPFLQQENRQLHSSQYFPPTKYSTPQILQREKHFRIGASPPRTYKACTCTHKASFPYTISFRLWRMSFEFQQEETLQHGRDCKFYGIKKKAKRVVKAQFPLKLAFFSARTLLTSFHLVTGTGYTGITFSYKNVVPYRRSPVNRLMRALALDLRFGNDAEWVHHITSTEQNIRFLYQNGEASPNDRDEDGLDPIANFWNYFSFYFMYKSLPENELAIQALVQFTEVFLQAACADEQPNPDNLLTFWRRLGDTNDNGIYHSSRGGIASCLMHEYDFDPVEKVLVAPEHWYNRDYTKFILSFHYAPNPLDCDMQLSPIIRAIILQSIKGLEDCIVNCRQSLMESIFGYSSLWLCVGWPLGLQKLLMTDALTLLNEPFSKFPTQRPIQRAIRIGCWESVDILLKADCSFDLCVDGNIFYYFSWLGRVDEIPTIASFDKVMFAIASHLALRRRRLVALAQEGPGQFQDLDGSDVNDGKAADICQELAKDSMFVHPCLEVDQKYPYTTIYHCYTLPLDYFPVFYQSGFHDHQYYNVLGQTPIMIKRPWFDYEDNDNIHLIPWLNENGFLNQVPRDPFSFGLGTDVTGWHYLAMNVGTNRYSLLHDDRIFVHQFPHFLKHISRAKSHDSCICWCINHDQGCSPLDLLWRSMAFVERGSDWMSHFLAHQKLAAQAIGESELCSIYADIVRVLAFDALEMTHTCCRPLPANSFKGCDQRMIQVDSKHDEMFNNELNRFLSDNWVIQKSDTDIFDETRVSDKQNQDAKLLESLVEDFMGYIRQCIQSNQSLSHFLCGHWRRKMSQLFAVDQLVFDEMTQNLERVETYVLPGRTKWILGEDFELQRPVENTVSESKNGEEETPE